MIGEIIKVFLYPKEEKEYLGLAKLIEKRGEGLTFINDVEDSVKPGYSVPIYTTEKWLVEFTESNSYNSGFRKVLDIKVLHTPSKKLFKNKLDNPVANYQVRIGDKYKLLKEDKYEES